MQKKNVEKRYANPFLRFNMFKSNKLSPQNF